MPQGRTLAPRSKPKCGCEWVQLTDALWACDHEMYGPAVHYAGAEKTARILMELAGGYSVLLARQRQKRRKKP